MPVTDERYVAIRGRVAEIKASLKEAEEAIESVGGASPELLAQLRTAKAELRDVEAELTADTKGVDDA